MDGFRTVKRAGHQGQRRRPRHRSGADARTGRRGRNGQRHLRGAPHPGVERRAVVRDLHDADREPAGAAPQRLHRVHLADARRHRRRRVGRRHPPRRRGPEQHHDGRHLGHGHGQQRHDAQHERRVDRRGQGADPGLPGGVRTVERHPDHGRHEVRHEPLPRIGLRLQDQLRLEREQLGQLEERRPQAGQQARHLRLLGGRSGRQARWQQQAVLLLLARISARPTPRSTTATRSACASRPRSSVPATSRRPSTTTATCSPPSGTTRRGRHFADGGVQGKIPANRLYSTGIALLNRYPLPNRAAGSGDELQLRGERPLGGTAHAAAGDPARLPAVVQAAVHGQVLRRARAPADDARADRGLHRRLQSQPVHHELRVHRQLRAHPDDLHGRHVRVHPQRAGGRQRGRRPGQRVGEPAGPDVRHPELPADLSRTPAMSIPGTTRTKC